jgi:hypothetical protein
LLSDGACWRDLIVVRTAGESKLTPCHMVRGFFF